MGASPLVLSFNLADCHYRVDVFCFMELVV